MPLPPSPDEYTLVVSATDEHPAIYKTSSGKLIAGENLKG